MSMSIIIFKNKYFTYFEHFDKLNDQGTVTSAEMKISINYPAAELWGI